MHTELLARKVQKITNKQTFVEGIKYGFAPNRGGRSFLQVGDQAFTKGVYLVGYEFITGRGKGTLSEASNAVNIEAFHLIDRHILGPEVDPEGVFLGMIPESDADRLRIGEPWIGLVGGLPEDFVRDVLLI